jgi:hypothetical protein
VARTRRRVVRFYTVRGGAASFALARRTPTLAPTPMRRLLTLLALIAATSCTDSTVGPVQTVDGVWSGVDNGYSISLNLQQDAAGAVTGEVSLANLTGFFEGTVTGTFVRPDLHLKLNFPGIQEISYDGTMSTTEAKIFGKLNGAGITNTDLDVRKR